jgi:hypothetical protein
MGPTKTHTMKKRRLFAGTLPTYRRPLYTLTAHPHCTSRNGRFGGLSEARNPQGY